MSYTPDIAVIFSGGMDSTTLVYRLLEQGRKPHLISFDYGQRHRKELEQGAEIAYKLGLKHDIIDLTNLTHLISNSALTSNTYAEQGQDANEIEVPEGHYAEDNMKKTVVPNRNMIMLSIAAGIAVNNSYENVATGVHAGDHFVYPDCRPGFIQAANAAIVQGNEGFGKIEKNIEGAYPQAFVHAPFLYLTKAQIAFEALRMNVPLHLTWSCYKGGEFHCGKCGTCVERLEAIDEAQGIFRQEYTGFGMVPTDATVYEDVNFWRQTVVSKGKDQ